MSSKNLKMIIIVVLVLYLLTKSGYSKEDSYEEYETGDQEQSYYKSNANFDVSPHVYVAPTAAQMAAVSAYSNNAYRDDNRTLTKFNNPSTYKSNATVNRKAYAGKFTPPTAAQMAAATSTPAAAPQKSSYGYGMAPVNF